MKRQPSDAASTSPSASGTRTRFRSARGSATSSANEPQAVKPGWKSRSQICVSPSRHGSHVAAAAAERHGHAVADGEAVHLGPGLDDHAAQLVPGHVRQHDRRVVAHPAVPVAAAHAGGAHLDDHAVGLAAPGRGPSSIDSGCSKACITAARIALLSPPWTR